MPQVFFANPVSFALAFLTESSYGPQMSPLNKYMGKASYRHDVGAHSSDSLAKPLVQWAKATA